MLEPMLASLSEASLTDSQLAYEPKYDGIRAVIDVAPGGKDVRIWSRLGNDKTHEFPGVARALAAWAKKRKAPLVLDGEVVALDTKGDPTSFQYLQRGGESAFIAFDLLKDGDKDLRTLPFTERRTALERLFSKTGSTLLRISEVVFADGRALYKRALEDGWEGLIAKKISSRYLSGKRSSDWHKLKISREQEFVVGGWTEPRQSRAHFGALLLGVYDGQPKGGKKAAKRALTYVGHVGTGFDARELTRLMKLFKPLEIDACPFETAPPGNERPHWLKPELVAQVKFTEWTADGNLRHPVYLGLRDDKKAQQVVRETTTRVHASANRLNPGQAGRAGQAGQAGRAREGRQARQGGRARQDRQVLEAEPTSHAALKPADTAAIVSQLDEIERGKGDGFVALPGGVKLSVTNLRKVFWPKQKYTKGDLLRYYAKVAPLALLAVADRPLVMKRFPNGIGGAPFYQHRAQHPPPGVRVETIPVDDEMRPQFIGGDIATLLHMTQLAAISQDPWFSRVQSLDMADYVALDLDPSDGVEFPQVLDVARWIHDELGHVGAVGVPKTSGASGLHIYLPLPPGTPYEAGRVFCQIVATVVAAQHPKQATIERFVKNRGKTVYVDYLQNIQGKTLATAYSARASEYAGVSTPLTWNEVHEGVVREDFTIVTTPKRFEKVGDLWAGVRKPKPLDLERLERYTRKHKLA